MAIPCVGAYVYAVSQVASSPAVQLASPSGDAGEPVLREFMVEGMTCASCARRVHRALTKVDGVLSAEIDLVRERARISAPSEVADEVLQAAAQRLGYQLAPLVPPAQEEASLAARGRSELTRALIALALAAAAMVAAMVPGVPGKPWAEILFAALCTFGPGLPILVKMAREARAFEASMDTLVGLGALVALASSLWTALGEHAGHGHTYAETAAMIIAFVLLGRALEERAKRGAGDAIRALSALRPSTARVVRHGEEALIPAEELRVGDEVRVTTNDRIPADGALLGPDGAFVDESWLTGESEPVRKSAGDALRAGSVATSTPLQMQVRAVGAGTELARVEALISKAQSSRAPVVRLADRVSAVFVPAMILTAIAATLGWYFFADVSALEALRVGVTVLVVACPCALGLATPTAITVGVGRSAKSGVLIRDASSLEALAGVDVVAFDKTGTLTEGRPALTEIVALGARSEATVLAWAAALEKESEHPIARAIVDAATARELALPSATEVESQTARGITGRVEGSAVRAQKVDEALEATLSADARARLHGLRGSAATVVALVVDDEVEALLAVRDPVRAGAPEALAALRAHGVRVHMLSGDHPRTALAVGLEVGLEEQEVHAGLLPEDKTRILASLRRSGGVAMVGDGVNDAPALASADVGIAMGSGAQVALETAGVTLAVPEPAKVEEALRLARATMRVIRRNLVWAFGYNVAMVPLAVFGLLDGLGGPSLASAAMAMSSITVVLSSLHLRSMRV